MKKFFGLFLAIACLLPLSCKKGGENEPGGETAKAVLGVQVKDAIAVYEVPQNQSVNLELAVVADPTSAEPYTVSVAAKPALVAGYNTKNGTSYQMLPAEAFTLTGSPVVLPRYSAKSSSFQVRLKGAGCEPEQVYVLPVAVDAVQGGTNFDAPDDKAAYILFKMIPTEEEGDGSKDNPFAVKDVEGFLAIDAKLQDDATTYFKLMEDLDFQGVSFTYSQTDDPFTPADGETINPWIPINYAANDDAVPIAEKRKIFFEGNGHKISNFKAGGALFGVLTGTVQNLTIENADIDCIKGNMGGVLAANVGTADALEEIVVKNVTIKGSKIRNDYKRVGALLAWLKGGIVEDCEVECTVFGSEQQVGGLIGRVEKGTLKNCSASGQITAKNYYAGGLVGLVSETVSIQNCHAHGSLGNGDAKPSYSRMGGFIGEMYGGSIENSSATGDVEAVGHFAGAFIGVADAKVSDITIAKSFATGQAINTPAKKAGYGALVGRMESGNLSISDSYCAGAVTAFRWSGGLVGDVNMGKLTITNSYSVSDLSAIGPDNNGNFECGHVVGKVRDAENTIISCSGVVAWKVNEGDSFCFPADAISMSGNYFGNDGTVSSQAKSLGWNEGIWDFSASEPKLK